MQKMTIILFAMAILLKPVLPVVDYIVNFDYIAKELCVNKDKKNLHCNGKCHLKSKLAQAVESSDKNLPEKKPKSSPEVLFFVAFADLLPLKPNLDNTQIGDCYADLYSYTPGKPFFHPPAHS